MGNRDYVRELCVLFSTARNKTRKKQPEIAKELDVSVGSIKQWESTGPPPSRDRIPSLAVAYAITEEQLHQAFDLIEQNKMPSVRHLLKPHKKKRHPSAESMYF